MEGSSTETHGTASLACDMTCQSSTDATGTSNTHAMGGITGPAGRVHGPPQGLDGVTVF